MENGSTLDGGASALPLDFMSTILGGVDMDQTVDGGGSTLGSIGGVNNMQRPRSNFEATMILLNRIAMNKNGATILINYGVIDIMTLCPVLYTPEQLIATNNGNSNGRNTCFCWIIVNNQIGDSRIKQKC